MGLIIIALGIIIIALLVRRMWKGALIVVAFLIVVMSFHPHDKATTTPQLATDALKKYATNTANAAPERTSEAAPEAAEPAAKAVAKAAKKAAEKAAEEAAAEAKAKAANKAAFISSAPDDALTSARVFDDSTLGGMLVNQDRYYDVLRVAMRYIAWVEVATSEARCPSLKANPKGIREVLWSGNAERDDRSILRATFAEYYKYNPAIFCNFAREQFGPNGKKRDEFRSNGTPMIDIVEPAMSSTSPGSPPAPSPFPDIPAEQRELFKKGIGQKGHK